MHPKLKNTQINKTTFKWNDSVFRLTGYYFVYNTRDEKRIFACVNKKEANAVSGYGVCGVILPIEEVQFLSRQSSFKNRQSNRKNMISRDRWKYHFLKKLPMGLSERQVNNRIVKEIVDETDA